MHKKENFGIAIRKLREQNGFPIRKVAAVLDIDPSTLSKIERNERVANKSMISKLAEMYNLDEDELLICYWSDKVAYELIDEKLPEEILKIAVEKIRVIKAHMITQGTLKLE
jgi:transcriptional regulator with XRE-family HTH domain